MKWIDSGDIDWSKTISTAFFLAAFVLTVLLSFGCTRIVLPDGTEYNSLLQNKSYDLSYTNPETGEKVTARINVNNDPAMKALDVADKALGVAATGPGVPAP